MANVTIAWFGVGRTGGGSLALVEQRIGFFDWEGRHVAYAAVGEGPAIVFPSWWLSHIELEWQQPAFRAFFERLAGRHTVLRYDRIGVGLSDRRREPAELSLQAEVAVLEGLLDHLQVASCSLVGISCGACIGAAFSRRNPDRVKQFVIYAGYAQGVALAPPEVRASLIDLVRSTWGFGSRVVTEAFMTGADAEERRAYARFQRAAASAEVAADLLELTFAFDAREDLTRLQMPTTVIHRTEDLTIPFAQGRKIATLVPGAQLIPLPGSAHHPWRGDASGTSAMIATALGVETLPSTPAAAQSLTDREVEVLALVARGFSDTAIAEQLTISRHTVHRHIANIRTKLSLPSRAAAAAYAARAGIG